MPTVKRRRSTLKIEDEFRAKADAFLKRTGFTVWWVPRTRLRTKGAEKDIFGVFDGIAGKGHIQIYIQLTDYTSHAKHHKKIVDWMGRKGIELPSAQLLSWHAVKQMFKVQAWVYNRRQPIYWLDPEKE